MVQAVVYAGIDAAAVLGIPGRPRLHGILAPRHVDDRLDRQVILLGEFEIPLIVRGHPHHRAFAVAHEHIVADPHRNGRTGDGMTHRQAGRHSLLFLRRELRLDRRAALAFLDERRQLRVIACRPDSESMLRCHRAERHAHERIRACRKRMQHALAVGAETGDVVRKPEPHSLALAYPIGLHGAHAVRPPRHMPQSIEQILGIVRDLQVIHRDFAFLDRRAGAPAAAVDHLLVREHGLIHRIPIDHPGLQVGNALFQHAQEQPLIPAIILRTAGGDLPAPIQGEPQGFELRFHGGDVVESPFRRRHPVRHGGVLGGQPEGIPPHGLQHILAVHAHESRKDVADGVVAHMPHVQAAAWIGEHA